MAYHWQEAPPWVSIDARLSGGNSLVTFESWDAHNGEYNAQLVTNSLLAAMLTAFYAMFDIKW